MSKEFVQENVENKENEKLKITNEQIVFLPLSDRLEHTYQGIKDFETAHSIAKTGLDDESKLGINALLDTLVVMNRFNLPVAESFQKIEKHIRKKRRAEEKHHLNRKLSMAYAEINNLPAAEKALKMPDLYLKPEDYLTLARSAKRVGKDPKPFIEKAKALSSLTNHPGYQGIPDDELKEYQKTNRLYNMAIYFPKIATTMHDLGLNPFPLLTESLEITKESDYQYSHRIDIAIAYGHCGDFKSALRIAGEQPTKNEAFRKLSRIALEQGDMDMALRIIKRTRDAKKIAKTYDKVILATAQQGKDTTELSQKSQRYHKQIKDTYEIVNHNSIISQVAHIKREDPLPFLEAAYSLFNSSNMSWLSIHTLANSIKECGYTTLPLIKMYEDEIEEIPEKMPENLTFLSNEYMDMVEQVMVMEELISMHFEFGNINHARNLLEKFKNHPLTIYEGMDDYLSLLCQLAANEMERGIPLSEIAHLPTEKIKEVYTNGDDKTREAIDYFGLEH